MAAASSIETADQPAPLLELTFPAELIDRAKVVQIAAQYFNTILQPKYKADIRLNFFKGFLGQGVIFASTAIFTIDTLYIFHSAAAALISIFLIAVAFVGFSAAHAARKRAIIGEYLVGRPRTAGDAIITFRDNTLETTMPLTTLAVDRSLLLAAIEDDDALSLVLDGFVIPVPKAALDETERNALKTLLAEWGLKIATVPKSRRRNPSWLTPAILLLLGVTAGLIQIVRR